MKKEVQRFWEKRSASSMEIIHKQFQDFNPDGKKYLKGKPKPKPASNFNCFILEDYHLPAKWEEIIGVDNCVTTLAIIFPTNYPQLPPVGFYLKVSLPLEPANPQTYAAAYEIADKTFILDQSQSYKWYFNDNMSDEDWTQNLSLEYYLDRVYKFLCI